MEFRAAIGEKGNWYIRGLDLEILTTCAKMSKLILVVLCLALLIGVATAQWGESLVSRHGYDRYPFRNDGHGLPHDGRLAP